MTMFYNVEYFINTNDITNKTTTCFGLIIMPSSGCIRMNLLVSYARVCVGGVGGTRSRAMVEGLCKLGGVPLAACVYDNLMFKPSKNVKK
jgi:hypothetical protein